MSQEYQMLIDGDWSSSETGEVIQVVNPATMEVIGIVPAATEGQVDKAVRSAAAVKTYYRDTTVNFRCKLLRTIGKELQVNREEIARVLCMEQGKSFLREAVPEVEGVAQNFFRAAEDLIRMNGEVISSAADGTKALVTREADGLYAVITPWNYPLGMAAQYVAPCLAVGNPIVFKPASATPLCGIYMARAIWKACQEVGAPSQIFQLVTGRGSVVGNCLVEHPLVDGIGFTGETSTGKEILRRAGLKKVVLELGGNGPTIVLNDCDIQAAAAGAAAGLLDNAGQICSGTERIFVQRGIEEVFIKALREQFSKVVLGDPLNAVTTMGPLNSEAGVKKVERHIQDAVDKGARLICGGKRAHGYGSTLFFEPTILDGVTSDMAIYQEETFGPVAPVTVFDTDEEALLMANSSGYGLQMAVFTSSLKRATYFSKRLRAGCISVNASSEYYEEHFPFGGAVGTLSGWGKVGGKFGLDQVSHLKNVIIHMEG